MNERGGKGEQDANHSQLKRRLVEPRKNGGWARQRELAGLMHVGGGVVVVLGERLRKPHQPVELALGILVQRPLVLDGVLGVEIRHESDSAQIVVSYTEAHTHQRLTSTASRSGSGPCPARS